MWSAIIASSRVRGPSYHPIIKGVIARANAEGFTLPNVPTLTAASTLASELDTIGYFAKTDLLLNFAYNDDSLENFSRINWKNPTGNLADFVRENKYNICGPSEDFTPAIWGKVGGSTITPNATTDPLGGNDGSRLVHGSRTQQNLGNNVIVGENYNWSMYAKADSTDQFRLHINSNVPTGNAVFDLTLGTVVSTQGSVVSADISDVGNGWWRCSINYVTLGSLICFGTTTVESSVFVWGAQLTRGATIQPYQQILGQRGLLLYDNEGVIGSIASVDNYVDTNWNILNDSVNYTLDDASRDIVRYNTISLNPHIISGVLSNSAIESWRSISTVAHRINQAANVSLNTMFDLSQDGYKAINRINSSTVTLFNKDITEDRTANSSATLVNDEIILGRAGANLVSDNVISYFSTGASRVAESQNFRTAYNIYLSSIGLNPIA